MRTIVTFFTTWCAEVSFDFFSWECLLRFTSKNVPEHAFSSFLSSKRAFWTDFLSNSTSSLSQIHFENMIFRQHFAFFSKQCENVRCASCTRIVANTSNNQPVNSNRLPFAQIHVEAKKMSGPVAGVINKEFHARSAWNNISTPKNPHEVFVKNSRRFLGASNVSSHFQYKALKRVL